MTFGFLLGVPKETQFDAFSRKISSKGEIAEIKYRVLSSFSTSSENVDMLSKPKSNFKCLFRGKKKCQIGKEYSLQIGDSYQLIK